ncbi:MAG: PaREP1 family protein [Acidianus infernus]|nr:PaREP1 family protein [Acidianus infernus]
MNYLEEADELLDRGDIVQASEKYYKAAEEAIKLISRRLNLEPILSEVNKKERWKSEILFKAARLINEKYPEVFKMSAWKLHEDGFHECSLDLETTRVLGEIVKNTLMKILS